MALGIYKPGQGYWVRVLSAVGGGALILATAAWAWGQAINVRLPARAYTFEVQQAPGNWSEGSGVSLFNVNPDTREQTLLGSGVIERFAASGTGGRVTVSSLSIEQGISPAETDLVATDAAPASVLRFSEEPIFDPLYLQGAIVAVILLVGMALVYLLVGMKRNSVDFLIATDGEMRKVNWSSRREVMGSTWVVIAAAFLISAALFGIDQVFAAFFRLINVLQT